MYRMHADFNKNAKFPHIAFRNACKAYAGIEKRWMVTHAYTYGAKELSERLKRRERIEFLISDYPEYADVPRWQSELDDINPEITERVEHYNQKMNRKADVTFAELASHGYMVIKNGQYSPHIPQLPLTVKSHNSGKKPSVIAFVEGTTAPKGLSDGYSVELNDADFKSLSPKHRHMLAKMLPDFLNQLAQYIKSDKDIAKTFDARGYGFSSLGLDRLGGIYHDRPLGKFDSITTDYRTDDEEVINLGFITALNSLGSVISAYSIPKIRTVLAIMAHWKNDHKANEFIETLDTIVDSGLLDASLLKSKDVFLSLGRNEEEPMNLLYDIIQPFGAYEIRRPYEMDFEHDIEQIRELEIKSERHRAQLSSHRKAMDELAENPDFADEIQRREKGLKKIRYNMEAFDLEYQEYKEKKLPKVIEAKQSQISETLDRVLDLKGINKDDIDLQIDDLTEKGWDHMSMFPRSRPEAYKATAKMLLTESEYKQMKEWNWRLKPVTDPHKDDGFSPAQFIDVVNNPNSYSNDNRPVGVSEQMLMALQSKPVVSALKKHLEAHPK